MAIEQASREDFYRNARTDIPGPLAGMRVLEVTTTWAGPRCGGVLADYGADVVRIEWPATPDICHLLPPALPGSDPPDGFLSQSANKNKRSIALDVRTEQGRDLFMRLLPLFDIVLENFKKGTMASWGCGYEDCRKVKPDIIYISITGFGQFGPYSDRPGYDPAAQAYSGFMWMNAAHDDDPPLRAPIFVADELAGLHGALAAIAALRHRDRTGEGQHIDVSLLDALMDSCTGLQLLAAANLPTPRIGNPMPFAAPTGVFKCKDGYVYAGVLLDTHWKIMAKMIGRPELADDPKYASFPGRIARRAEVDEILESWCLERTREEVVQACSEAQIAVAAIYTPQEAVINEHVIEREAVAPITNKAGNTIRLNNTAAKFSRTPAKNRSCAPHAGEHTDEFLKEAGLNESEIEALRNAGAIL